MTANPGLVLIVDDDALSHKTLEHSLGHAFRFLHAYNGPEALQQLDQAIPDAIVLDVQMPGPDGYEICRRIKDGPAADAPVLFLSGLDSIESRLKGFDAGGNDYLLKPVAPDELHRRLDRAIRSHEEVLRLRHEAHFAMSTAMTAMSSAGELGVVLQCLKKSFNCHSFEEMAAEITTALDSYCLVSIVQLRTQHGSVQHALRNAVTPLEQQLLERLTDHPRFVDVGRRTIVNFPKVSLLIKNMPVGDEVAYGRMRDNLALLAEAADARVRAMETEMAMEKQAKLLVDIALRAADSLHAITARQSAHHAASSRIVEEMQQEIESQFHVLGLTDAQESRLMKIIEDGVNRALALRDQALELDGEFAQVVQTLIGSAYDN